MKIREILSSYFKGDRVIWGVILALSMFSLLAVYSSTGTLAYKYQSGNTFYFFLRQFSFLAFGLAIVVIAHMIPFRYYSRIAQLFFYISIPLLLATLIIGTNINQASRWLTLPGLGFTFQTSDFAKLALIMYLARMLSKKQDVIKSYREAFRPLIIPVLITCCLILPANFSTAALLFITTLILLFIGRVNLKHLSAFVGIIIATGLLFGLLLWFNPDLVPRGETWKNRLVEYFEGDSEGNYQAEQAKIAVGTGGIFGKLPGNSTQRNYLPHPYSDFIFAIIVEEYGIIGAIAIILLYMILLYRAGMIVKRSKSQFGAFVTIGLTLSLVFQAIVHMGVAVNIFPVTGQTLPLVSWGGTSILFTSTALGIILSVSRATQNITEYEQGAA
ncbi:MAG: FtsW/RodA/SpoVE family cell cycle protein [Bacteroidetes bacterium]|nr:FtsW/RodA/SpoVE family cell cycle protein [Bacteroidota bacterium]